MKAMILAAGRGARLRPLTDTTPKPLVKVGKYRLIEYHIAALKIAGIKKIVINISWLAEQIKSTLGDGSRYGIELIYSDESERALETAGGIINALPMLGDEPFIVCNADVWSDFNYSKLKIRDKFIAHLVLVKNPSHNPDGDFFLNNTIVSDAATNPTPYTFSGIGIYRPDLFAGLAPEKKKLAPLLQRFMQKGLISGELHSGLWHDLGTADRLHKLQRYLKEKNR